MSIFWTCNIYHEFYLRSDLEREKLIGKIFFDDTYPKTIYIPVECDDETTKSLYDVRYNVVTIFNHLNTPSEMIKVVLHSIDDPTFSIEWNNNDITEYFADMYLIPKVIDYIRSNAASINGDQLLEYCNNIIPGYISYD